MKKVTVIATALAAMLIVGSATSALAYGHNNHGWGGHKGRGDCGPRLMVPPQEKKSFTTPSPEHRGPYLFRGASR